MDVSESDRAKQLEFIIEELRKAESYYVVIKQDGGLAEFVNFKDLTNMELLDFIHVFSLRITNLFSRFSKVKEKH